MTLLQVFKLDGQLSIFLISSLSSLNPSQRCPANTSVLEKDAQKHGSPVARHACLPMGSSASISHPSFESQHQRLVLQRHLVHLLQGHLHSRPFHQAPFWSQAHQVLHLLWLIPHQSLAESTSVSLVQAPSISSTNSSTLPLSSSSACLIYRQLLLIRRSGKPSSPYRPHPTSRHHEQSLWSCTFFPSNQMFVSCRSLSSNPAAVLKWNCHEKTSRQLCIGIRRGHRVSSSAIATTEFPHG